MTLRACAVLAGLVFLPPAALALPPCVGTDLATALPKATEVAQNTLDVPAARFSGIWQQGQLNGFAYRIFPDLTAIVFDERANAGWRIDLICTEAARCQQTVVGTAPEAARAAAKAIGECLVPPEKIQLLPAPAAAAPLAAKETTASPALKAPAKPAPDPKAKLPAPAIQPAIATAPGQTVKPEGAAKPSPPTPEAKPTGAAAPAPVPTPAPPIKTATPLPPTPLPKVTKTPNGGISPTADVPGRNTKRPSAETPATGTNQTATLAPSRLSSGAAKPKGTAQPLHICPAPSPADRGSAMRAIQRLLTSLGANPGPIDGVKGKRTAEALRAMLGPDAANLDAVSILIVLTGVICTNAPRAE
jgi:hypothetical protein